MNTPDVAPRLDPPGQLDVVEIYPYVEYAKYLLAGSTALWPLRGRDDRWRHYVH